MRNGLLLAGAAGKSANEGLLSSEPGLPTPNTENFAIQSMKE